MKNNKLDAIGYVDDHLVEKAENYSAAKKRNTWIKWASIAACLCLVVGAVFAISNFRPGNHVQIWNDSYSYKQYFKYSNSGDSVSESSSLADSAIPYAETRSFSDDRTTLESESIIPAIETHPIFSAEAHYNSDGSLYSIVLSWHRRDTEGQENYSDLSVTAGYEEVPQIDDCIAIEIDDEGNIIEPGVTVTERDGIRIVATGNENQKKVITFKNDNGWYQITGSWNDSYEAVVELLDWFWNHPIDFSRFPIDAGDEFTDTSLLEMPDTFSEYLPDFQKFGFLYETSTIMLKNGEPISLEADYVSNVTEEQVGNSEYKIGENGCTTIHWCIDANTNAYDLEGCIGNLEDLTQEQVLSLKPADDVTTETKVKFIQDGFVVTVYASDINEAWELIESIK
ncbi:MAG TPA: hypothetical protein O0X32_02925 [Methanocorpusculum sp.]|nr:hypothetical protein [Methanocorpusculum sp.]